MAHTYLSDMQVSARYGVHRSTPWRWAKTDPSFPEPVILTPGCTRWKLADLQAWEAAKHDSAA
ncbi:putative transcriptional regulator [Phaeobacter inhibens]|uniref:Transcriptional regulator n=1 Tax=Phaeobacter inhibens TaxID=221822 RepID=A0A2I7M1E4_9RHOB|nr:putative transcriptional regulator [Phaeobacter inhibens]AUQ53196.1 putative transcriptional regulator [Phaeobacter inhibens]AUQ77212.1 putative transcriptional regulator [Phaeobacter inhibens]AUQ95613.1 putative transcriptional regulator [Phaeobacter inhibens]AUQ97914.1 putative transcriptional regulator [Phaeobacter inhibens]